MTVVIIHELDYWNDGLIPERLSMP